MGQKFPPNALFFKCLDIFLPVQDAPSNLDVLWSFLESPQSLNGKAGLYDFCSATSFSNFSVTGELSAVPVPTALPLFATGLGVLGLLGWRRKRKALAAA